ncbi:hypothetical protein CASFOL_025619 [Castilleja foliolosa]|uniref:DUF3741 domain-containing protein n=1 Tax=Castilleja foliolosa TaxID=1961234 RepID=A0ABD3CVE5_9LAMI
MLNRQESSLSSSRRQAAAAATATPPPSETHHAKAIGCMSGIFRLFSKYQNPNKRITLGRKSEKLKPSSPTKAKKSRAAAKHDKIEQPPFDDTKRLTCAIKVPRSPTLPPEIRRPSATAVTAPDNPKTPPSSSLVARLMGLDPEGLAKAAMKSTPAAEEDRVGVKRRRLLQALEKCNEDLEALKRIIKAVQTTDVRVQPTIPVVAAGKVHTEGGDVVFEEAAIPAAVAEVVKISTEDATRVPQQRKPLAARKPGEDDEPITKPFSKPTINIESSLRMRRQATASVTVPLCSRAMVKSVEEVCGDIDWGEKREIGRIGLVLQDHLCRDLIEDLVRELLKSCHIDHYSLPFEACKRRLCF